MVARERLGEQALQGRLWVPNERAILMFCDVRQERPTITAIAHRRASNTGVLRA
jgi:hypothetical protein